MRGKLCPISNVTSENNPPNAELDLHKIYIDDESYNSGHGHAYEFYGVDEQEGATVVVRPDQCKLMDPTFKAWDNTYQDRHINDQRDWR